MPTLQDVARRAGVSTATVSKVLSNTPYFSDATRDKVLRAVEELGYVPNLAARALSTGRTHIIAVIFPYIYDAIFEDPAVTRILEGIEAEATPGGYNLLLNTPRLNEDEPDPHYQQLIASNYIDGLIAIDSVPDSSVVDVAVANGIPTVVVGYHKRQPYLHSDDESGGRQLMQHLLDLGHRAIGIITVKEHINTGLDRRLAGIQAVATECGLDCNTLPIATGDYSTASGAEAARTLLDAHPHLTALICLNDRMAMGAIQHARSIGRTVPDDLSVVGYDNIAMAEMFTPPLTTVDQQAPELGRRAAQMLFDLLNDKKPQSLLLPALLIRRGSTAAIRSQKSHTERR